MHDDINLCILNNCSSAIAHANFIFSIDSLNSFNNIVNHLANGCILNSNFKANFACDIGSEFEMSLISCTSISYCLRTV